MSIRDEQVAPTGQSERCNTCRHCIEVRGMAEVVCLAYLTIRHPLRDPACGEFETKKIKSPVPVTQ